MKIGKTEKIIGAIAIVALALIGSSYWVGSLVEQKFKESVDWASRQGMPVSMGDYKRGIFGATAVTDVVFPMPSKEDPSVTEEVTVSIVHSIRHGPLPALTAAVRIHSEAQAQPAEEKTEGFSGAGHSPFPVLDVAVGWTGRLTLHATVTRDNLYYQDKDVSDSGAVYGVELKNIRVVADASMKGWVLQAGELKFDADRIVMEGETKETIDNISLTFLAENIDLEISDTAFQTMQGGSAEHEQTAIQFLSHKPVFAIKDARARWQEGEAEGSFRIAYVGNPDPDAKLSFSFKDWSGDLQMSLPRALAVRHMSTQERKAITDELEDGEENEVDIEKETKEKVDKKMSVMLEQGVFTEKGDTLTVGARLEDGKLHLNGKEQPVQILLELLPPFL
jgi:uncharacterized protein YdgA (DUF945 family)